MPARDRARLDRVCRYLLRPPLAQERVRVRPDGRVLVELKAPRRDGTTALRFEPLEFLEKLAAITPRPAINLLVHHGVLAPHAPARRHVVGYGRPAPEPPVLSPAGSGADRVGPRDPRQGTRQRLSHVLSGDGEVA